MTGSSSATGPARQARRVAAIDCGTNSIRLLIADVDPADGLLVDVDRRMEIVRLGEGVDRTKRLAPAALDRTFEACGRYAEAITDAAATRVRFVATSASRDATNRDVFVEGVSTILGVEPEVITGAEEARLSFLGATRELAGGEGDEPYLVVDIGGGSTEFVMGSASDAVGDGTSLAERSVDIGCVRLTERHLRSDPPTPDEVTAARADISAAIDVVEQAVPLATARTLVGLAGSVTTVAADALHLPAYDATRIHHSRISAADVAAVADRFLTMSRGQRAALPFMHPGRVDVIGAGALILATIVTRVGVADVLVSEHDILDGIAWSLV